MCLGQKLKLASVGSGVESNRIVRVDGGSAESWFHLKFQSRTGLIL